MEPVIGSGMDPGVRGWRLELGSRVEPWSEGGGMGRRLVLVMRVEPGWRQGSEGEKWSQGRMLA